MSFSSQQNHIWILFVLTCAFPRKNLLVVAFRVKKSMMVRERKTPVNSVVKIPIINVTANPLIGPVPYVYKTTPAINVVMFCIDNGKKGLSKPVPTAERSGLPNARSSIIRS